MNHPVHSSNPVQALLLDDGEFIVELAADESPREARAFLRRRCYEGVTTPDGHEWIGSVVRDGGGFWSASIDTRYDERTGRDWRELGVFTNRLAAIAVLWQARHAARCRHQEG